MFQAFNTIFSSDQIEQAKKLYGSLSSEQKFWLSGYLAGVNQSGGLLNGSAIDTNGAALQGVNGNAASTDVVNLTILYGTHTGNSKQIAEQVAELAESSGIKVTLSSMPDYKNRQLKEETNLLVIVSTHGEGDPPVSAEDFYSYIFGKKAPKSEKLNFAVIGLGDSSYANFCKTGKDIYNQLKVLGAKNVHELVELDVDYKEHIADILPEIISKFSGQSGNGIASQQLNKPSASVFDADKWVEAEVLDKVMLNGRGSQKETYHIELDIEDTGIQYQPGDALEVVAKNNTDLVGGIRKKLSLDGDGQVDVNGQRITLKEALISRFEITIVTIPVLKKYAEVANNKELNDLLENTEKLQKYLYGVDFLDVLNEYPATFEAQQLINILRKLPARLYSISSSYEYNPDEVHITVGAVRYHLNDREHHGVCSGFLADQINIGETVFVRIKKNEGFRLPQDNDAKVIMVGPGTGIAPFRAFLQEREAVDAKGENWLFFGDQHFETDFLYQAELLHHRKKGVLNEISVAFSRDQDEKIYVQHRMKEKGDRIYKWLKEGAYFYLCGDMNKMAKDVKKELVNLIEVHGKMTTKDAAAFLKEVRAEGRFQEDVY